MLLPTAVLAIAVMIGLAGAKTTRRLSGWLRVASALVPLLVVLGGAVTYFLLVICNVGDTVTEACRVTTGIALPLTLAYMGVTGGSWLTSLARARDESRQAVLVKISAATAVAVPVVVLVGLLAYYQQ